MFTHAQFLADVEAFLARTGMSPTAFGREALSDPSFVFDLRDGRSPGLAIVERVYRFIREWRAAAQASRTEEAAA